MGLFSRKKDSPDAIRLVTQNEIAPPADWRVRGIGPVSHLGVLAERANEDILEQRGFNQKDARRLVSLIDIVAQLQQLPAQERSAKEKSLNGLAESHGIDIRFENGTIHLPDGFLSNSETVGSG
jgi:hypothetical protein